VGEFVAEPPEAFSHLGFALRNATDLESVVQAVVRELVALPDAVRAGVALVEGGGRRLRFRISDSDEWCHIDAYDDVPLTAVVRTGSPILGGLDDFGGQFAGMVARQRENGVRALAAWPLPGQSGPTGGIAVFYDQPQEFGPAQRKVLDAAARRTAEAVSRVREHDRGAPLQASDLPGEGLQAATIVLEDSPRAAGDARRFLRDKLRAWRVANDTVETAQLLVSELVTNAVVHAGTTSVLTATLLDDRLVVRVRDRGRGSGPVLLPDDDPTKVFGRGLLLVDALSDGWGTESDDQGSTSWFGLAVREEQSGQRTG
jgi:anti-sigma regulatory factor (Ser/Thr protein kinase)